MMNPIATPRGNLMSEQSKVVEDLIRQAEAFKTRKSFQEQRPDDYALALKLGVLDVVCAHMLPLTNFMTREHILKLASGYETMRNFRREQASAYTIACGLGILPELYLILKRNRQAWPDEKLIQGASGYHSMQEVLHGDRRLYHALRRKLMSDPEFLKRAGRLDFHPTYARGFTSCVYLYSFEDGVQYVGYTSSKEQRHRQHAVGYGEYKITSSVFRHAAEIGQPVPKPQILIDGVSDSEALRLEAQEIKFRRLAGIVLLNKTIGGAGGSLPRKWNYEKARAMVILCKYKGFNYFQMTYGGAFIWLYNPWTPAILPR